jgi:hypothetical protein
MFKPYLFVLVCFSLLLNSCKIGFNPYDLDASIENFSVEQFDTEAGNAPPTLGQQFSEFLKQRILNNTRLEYKDAKGHIEFSGAVTSYQVSSIAPKQGETVSLQRLTIAVKVDFKNNQQEDKDWSQTFRRFADFSADADLSSVEEQLVEEIYDQVMEDVFNKAFSNW